MGYMQHCDNWRSQQEYGKKFYITKVWFLFSISKSFVFNLSPDFGEQENVCLFHVEYCVPAQWVCFSAVSFD